MNEAMKLALDAMEYADACLKKQLTTKTKHEYAQDLLMSAGIALHQAIAEAEKQINVLKGQAWHEGKCPVCGTVDPAEAEKQEPVGQLQEEFFGRGQVMWFKKPNDQTMLYTHPPKREWVGLTDADILDALQPHYEEWEASELLDLSSEDYKLIEAKLKEKNHDR